MCGNVKYTRRVQRKRGGKYLEAVSAFLSSSEKKLIGKIQKKRKKYLEPVSAFLSFSEKFLIEIHCACVCACAYAVEANSDSAPFKYLRPYVQSHSVLRIYGPSV